jgi:hypothetical protein
MATFSKKMMGKEVGDASVYAEPHHMTGKKFIISDNPGKEANSSKLDTMDVSVGQFSKSAGDEKVKTDGIRMRGTGCATKGVMSRGPMG